MKDLFNDNDTNTRTKTTNINNNNNTAPTNTKREPIANTDKKSIIPNVTWN